MQTETQNEAGLASGLSEELDASVIDDEQSYCVFTGKPIEQVLANIGQELKLEKGCECRFKDECSNTVLICEECSKLPCHNRY
jgi:hypothetical protein